MLDKKKRELNKSINNKKKVYISTFGCRLNQADEALIFGRLAKLGYEPASETDKKDLIIVNTCTVTSSAAQKSRQALRKLRRENPYATIAVTGCDAEINPEFWKNENTCDLVIKGSQKNKIDEILFEQSHLSAKIANNTNIFTENANSIFPFKSRALVKIQEGCDQFCAYCIVPFARGKPRSRDFNEIIEECKRLIQKSYAEIVLTGVNICRYSDNGRNLAGLVSAILSLDGNFRLRLSSTEPDRQLYDIIAIMKENSALCRFLHVPLQHGSEKILKAMKRKYSAEYFANFAEFAVKNVPGIHIGTDIICGLPGEDDKIFLQSLDFIEKMPLANIHIFRYSPRIGTEAAKFANRPHGRDVKKRMKILANLKSELSAKFIASQIGQNASFIGEKKYLKNFLTGWSDNYVKTTVKSESKLGEIIKIKFIKSEHQNCLLAEKINP